MDDLTFWRKARNARRKMRRAVQYQKQSWFDSVDRDLDLLKAAIRPEPVPTVFRRSYRYEAWLEQIMKASRPHQVSA